jgi:hypothetical protein
VVMVVVVMVVVVIITEERKIRVLTFESNFTQICLPEYIKNRTLRESSILP